MWDGGAVRLYGHNRGSTMHACLVEWCEYGFCDSLFSCSSLCLARCIHDMLDASKFKPHINWLLVLEQRKEKRTMHIKRIKKKESVSDLDASNYVTNMTLEVIIQ